MGFIQILILLVQVFPSALKAVKAWKEYHGAELDRERRIKLSADIKDMVHAAIESKDTSGIESAIKNLGKPDSQNPS